MRNRIKKLLNSLLRVNEIKECVIKNQKMVRYHNRLDILKEYALHSDEYGTCDTEYAESAVTVSLTTYGRRLNDVSFTIESLFNQTLKANRIILWLSNDMKGKRLPYLLERQLSRGLTIGYCEDIKSYKKLIPTLKKYPDDIIITVDDDVLYPVDFIENLLVPYLENPKEKNVYCNRCHEITFDRRGHINKYKDWQQNVTDTEASPLLMPTGVGGVLYPPHCFHPDVTKEDIFMKLAPKADDIWFKAMTLMMGYKVKLGYRHSLSKDNPDYLDNVDIQDMALGKYNVINGGNDIQFENVASYYDLKKWLLV